MKDLINSDKDDLLAVRGVRVASLREGVLQPRYKGHADPQDDSGAIFVAVVRLVAFQGIDPGSNPGHCNTFIGRRCGYRNE